MSPVVWVLINIIGPEQEKDWHVFEVKRECKLLIIGVVVFGLNYQCCMSACLLVICCVLTKAVSRISFIYVLYILTVYVEIHLRGVPQGKRLLQEQYQHQKQSYYLNAGGSHTIYHMYVIFFQTDGNGIVAPGKCHKVVASSSGLSGSGADPPFLR